MKEKLEQRAKVWKKCKEIGRCVCSMPNSPFPCVCKYFIKHKICKCNGEELKEGDTIEDWVKFNTIKIEK